jgi:hypothetical protein
MLEWFTFSRLMHITVMLFIVAVLTLVWGVIFEFWPPKYAMIPFTLSVVTWVLGGLRL